MIMKDLKTLRMTKQLDPQSMSPTIAPNQKLEETTDPFKNYAQETLLEYSHKRVKPT